MESFYPLHLVFTSQSDPTSSVQSENLTNQFYSFLNFFYPLNRCSYRPPSRQGRVPRRSRFRESVFDEKYYSWSFLWSNYRMMRIIPFLSSTHISQVLTNLFWYLKSFLYKPRSLLSFFVFVYDEPSDQILLLVVTLSFLPSFYRHVIQSKHESKQQLQ